MTNTNEPYTSLFTLACYVRSVHIGRGGSSLRIPKQRTHMHTDAKHVYIFLCTYVCVYILARRDTRAGGQRDESLRHSSSASSEMPRNLNIYWNLKVPLLGVFKSLPKQ